MAQPSQSITISDLGYGYTAGKGGTRSADSDYLYAIADLALSTPEWCDAEENKNCNISVDIYATTDAGDTVSFEFCAASGDSLSVAAAGAITDEAAAAWGADSFPVTLTYPRGTGWELPDLGIVAQSRRATPIGIRIYGEANNRGVIYAVWIEAEHDVAYADRYASMVSQSADLPYAINRAGSSFAVMDGCAATLNVSEYEARSCFCVPLFD
jgi:hypothetical protein